MTRDGSARTLHAVGAAFVLTLGVDLFLHAGLLARLYVDGGPFLLAPREAFRRIPAGYAGFLVLTVALQALLRALDVRGARRGWLLGLGSGAVVWGALALGLFSISSAPWPLLLGWFAGQAVELGLAGAVLGAARAGVSPKGLWMRVAGAVVACVTLTVLLQALGLAPSMEVAG